MSVRSAARLDVADVFGVCDIRDVEDPDAANTLLAHRRGHTLSAAIQARRRCLGRHEQQVLVDGHVALRGRAIEAYLERRMRRVRDVPDLISVVAPLDRVRTDEREIRIGRAGESLRGSGVRDKADVPLSLARVPESRLEANACVGTRRDDRQSARLHRAAAGGGRGVRTCRRNRGKSDERDGRAARSTGGRKNPTRET